MLLNVLKTQIDAVAPGCTAFWFHRLSNAAYRCPHPKRLVHAGTTGDESPKIDRPLFLQVSGNQLGHLEHADLLLAFEHRCQRLVSIDLGPHLFILQPILADVGPELFR